MKPAGGSPNDWQQRDRTSRRDHMPYAAMAPSIATGVTAAANQAVTVRAETGTIGNSDVRRRHLPLSRLLLFGFSTGVPSRRCRTCSRLAATVSDRVGIWITSTR